MLKILIIFIFLPLMFLFSVSDKTDSSNSFLVPSPTKTPSNEKFDGVENLTLDSENVSTWCPYSYSDSGECSEYQLNVKVKAFSKEAEKNNLNYYYTVSGGKIIGQGTNVVWNFSDVTPGEYTITASVGTKNNTRGKTQTKIVNVRECSCCLASCECPTISVTSSKKTVYKGETVEFTVDVNGGSQTDINYNWTVENGTIIEGQGTSKIKVQISSGETATAIVDIGGLCESCPTSDSESVKISK